MSEVGNSEEQIVAAIGFAGGVSIMGLLGITRSRAAGVAMSERIKIYRHVCGGLFSFGIGMVLVISVRSL